VDDLACTFGISRSLLNVVSLDCRYWISLLLIAKTAAAKGLVAGNFVVQRTDGSSVMGLSEKEVRSTDAK
jgi:meiotic recombination protein SPO11